MENGNPWHRRKSQFSDFDEEEFEESDRDSDFDAIITEVEEEEPTLAADTDAFNEWDLEPEEQAEASGPSTESPWDDAPPGDSDDEQVSDEQDLWDMDINPRGSFDDDPPDEEVEPLPLTRPAFTSTTDPADDWEELEEEAEYEEEEERELNISLGMIVVVVFALVLLGAGGYGIIEERSQLQEEIRQLQASLATSAPPSEVAATRDAAAQANERNAQLLYQVEDLSRKNRSLQAIITGLESQLAAQKEVLEQAETPVAPAAPATVAEKKPAPAPAAPPEPKPEPKQEPKPEPKPQVASAQGGDWFVNFSSYSQRGTAENWAAKVKPDKGRVVVAAAESNGKTIYRVRVIDLPDRATAEAVARDLEQQFKMGKLWVGRAG